MRRASLYTVGCLLILTVCLCRYTAAQSVHIDKPFIQDYSIKYFSENPELVLYKAYEDRNGFIKLLTSKGLMRLRGERFYTLELLWQTAAIVLSIKEILPPGALSKPVHIRR